MIVGLLDRLDPVLVEALGLTALLATADALLDVEAAMAEPGLVVWDAGPIDRLLTDLAAIDALPVMLDHAVGPLVGMLIGQALPGDQIAAASDVVTRLTRALRLTTAPGTRVVIVDEPTSGLAERIRSIRSRLELLSIAVDRVIVNRVPRSKDDWPGAWAKQRRLVAKSLKGCDLPVTSMPWFIAKVERGVARRLPDWSTTRQTRPQPAEVVDAGDSYAYRIPLAWADPERVRVGRLGATVVVEVDGLRRLLALPSVLARCTVQGAGIVGDDLVVRFVPDPEQWRSAS